MLYKFKSQATADVLMVEHDARQILTAIGKEPGARGIVTAEQIPAAIAALEDAIARDEAMHGRAHGFDDEKDDQDPERPNGVSLRQHAVPFIALLRSSAAAGKDVVWGV